MSLPSSISYSTWWAISRSRSALPIGSHQFRRFWCMTGPLHQLKWRWLDSVVFLAAKHEPLVQCTEASYMIYILIVNIIGKSTEDFYFPPALHVPVPGPFPSLTLADTRHMCSGSSTLATIVVQSDGCHTASSCRTLQTQTANLSRNCDEAFVASFLPDMVYHIVPRTRLPRLLISTILIASTKS